MWKKYTEINVKNEQKNEDKLQDVTVADILCSDICHTINGKNVLQFKMLNKPYFTSCL